jgi:hypothetical protein
MIIRKEKESYILDAYDDDQRPKDKRHDAIDIRFRQGDGMIAVKAFLESVEGACPDVAKNYTQGADNQFKGCIFEGVVIEFRVGVGKIGFIEKWGIQSQHYKSVRKRKFTKGSLSATADFLIPGSYRNCRAGPKKIALSKGNIS